jgi:hypothetical protein
VSEAVQALLDSFNALSEAEQHEAAVELLRRVERTAMPELSDEALVTVADDLFRKLDANEAVNAGP